jgi:SAM-dependent methyltransferase
MNFGPLYSSGYDLLNVGKDYTAELDFVFNTISSISGIRFEPQSVIDFGCGSGRHLAELGSSVAKVVGVDRSAEMLAIARMNLPNTYHLVKSEIGEFKTSEKFELVMSLFHVASYQTTVSEILIYWQSLSKCVSNDGYIFVDFWHRPAWESDPPVKRVTKKTSQELVVTRVSTPIANRVLGTVDIDIEVNFKGQNGSEEKYMEIHKLRAFTLLEIELASQPFGLEIVKSGTWLDERNKLEPESWYGYVVLRKSQFEDN